MKPLFSLLAGVLFASWACRATAAVLYVSVGSTNPVPPYANWATAASTIQDAVDAAAGGDQVLVTNGVYGAGGRFYAGLNNRVYVATPVVLQSVNGPAVTVIRGDHAPGTITGTGACRCVYLGGGAVLSGFTLTNGATLNSGDWLVQQSGGGVLCDTATALVSNCVLTANAAASNGGGAYAGTLANCTLTANSASLGGGACSSAATNSTLAGNSASNGGGAYNCSLANCALTANSASDSGGGAYQGSLTGCSVGLNSASRGGGAYSSALTNCTLTKNAGQYGGGANAGSLANCVLTSNRASYGGGAASATLVNCTLTGNSGNPDGGGAYFCQLTNCALNDNQATYGGGAYSSTLINCTVTGNSADQDGSGLYTSTASNCLIYYNTVNGNACPATTNCYSSTLSYCCTTPLPASGAGNFDAEPGLASAWHLGADSPCLGKGNAAYATGVDIDGEAWATPPAVGCDEVRSGTATGLLVLSIDATYTNVAAGFSVGFTGNIVGNLTASRWEFGDGIVLSNRPYASHAWTSPGDYLVVLRGYNLTYPDGLTATLPVHVVAQPVHYVVYNSRSPMPPYTSWASASITIQEGINASSVPGALVLVSNGVFHSGSSAVYGTMYNRVAVTKPVIVQSLNGPEVTVIQGAQVAGTTNGNGAVRCVYLGPGAALSGFTLSGGATRTAGDAYRENSGGGVWCASPDNTVSNCIITGNSAAYAGAGAYCGTLIDCTLTTNSIPQGEGGGAYSATLVNCALAGNRGMDGGGAGHGTLVNCALSANAATDRGGGAYSSMLSNCTLAGNSVINYGGAVSDCALSGCTLAGNSASYGGGSYSSHLTNCALTSNSATNSGGGACYGTLVNCTLNGNFASAGGGVYSGSLTNCALTSNSATNSGGGAGGGTLVNCTLTENSATSGGGTADSTLVNCIAYYNTARSNPNYLRGTLSFCCSAPLAPGPGNLDADPQLASASHLGAASPCRAAGNAAYARGTDLDGEPWGNPPSIGCDEFYAGAASGPLTVSIQATYTNLATHCLDEFVSTTSGYASANYWDFGDGTVVSNRLNASHAWAEPGDYTAVLRLFNETFPEGVSASVLVHVINQTVYYVAQTNASPEFPYNSWSTAATNIQDAVDAVGDTGALVLVADGTYGTGGKVVSGTLTNRLAVTGPITVQSVNGPAVTTIQGYQVPGSRTGDSAVRCVYLADGAALTGFTLTNGATLSLGNSGPQTGGAGAYCESTSARLSRCVLIGNSASGAGGGAYSGTLENCLVVSNTASFGGGASESVLANCTLVGNSAGCQPAGVISCTLNNCIICDNGRSGDLNYYSDSILNYCCTFPLPQGGAGNFTNLPLFMAEAVNNFRLQDNSPCINSGLNTLAPGDTDLDGFPRIAGGTVDVGAYEFHTPSSAISYAWLQQYGLPTDGSADTADPDGHGFTNWQEWRADTDPNDASSTLRLLGASATSSGITVRWISVTNRTYFLERTTNLCPVPVFSRVRSNISGQAGATSYTDTEAAGLGSCFYRVGVP